MGKVLITSHAGRTVTSSSGTRSVVPARSDPTARRQPPSKSFTSKAMTRCVLWLSIFGARSPASEMGVFFFFLFFFYNGVFLAKRNIKAMVFVQSVTNNFFHSLQACQSFYPKAVCGQRKPGLYKPQGMTCMVGLTVSSQEKSRLLFWSKNLNSSSPRQNKTRMSTESHTARAK